MLIFFVDSVNGGLSEWDNWSSCIRPCGISKRIRRRECNNPTPRFGGKHCPLTELTFENQTCVRMNCSGKFAYF